MPQEQPPPTRCSARAHPAAGQGGLANGTIDRFEQVRELAVKFLPDVGVAGWAKLVLGYPDLYDLSRSSTCIGLSTKDRTALNGGADALDSALAAAALENNDTFADVRPQFSGHEICDSGSWLNSVDIFAISSSYHPNASGQEQGYEPVFSRYAG